MREGFVIYLEQIHWRCWLGNELVFSLYPLWKTVCFYLELLAPAASNSQPVYAEKKANDCAGNVCATCGYCRDWKKIDGRYQRASDARCLRICGGFPFLSGFHFPYLDGHYLCECNRWKIYLRRKKHYFLN